MKVFGLASITGQVLVIYNIIIINDMAYKWLTLNKNFDMTSWATGNNDIPNN